MPAAALSVAPPKAPSPPMGCGCGCRAVWVLIRIGAVTADSWLVFCQARPWKRLALAWESFCQLQKDEVSLVPAVHFCSTCWAGSCQVPGLEESGWWSLPVQHSCKSWKFSYSTPWPTGSTRVGLRELNETTFSASSEGKQWCDFCWSTS